MPTAKAGLQIGPLGGWDLPLGFGIWDFLLGFGHLGFGISELLAEFGTIHGSPIQALTQAI
jgi:hypothetical protein